jgi:hypothetical protein
VLLVSYPLVVVVAVPIRSSALVARLYSTKAAYPPLPLEYLAPIRRGYLLVHSISLGYN